MIRYKGLVVHDGMIGCKGMIGLRGKSGVRGQSGMRGRSDVREQSDGEDRVLSLSPWKCSLNKILRQVPWRDLESAVIVGKTMLYPNTLENCKKNLHF